MQRNSVINYVVISILVLLSAFSRLVDHPMNFTPMIAILLFSNVFIGDKLMKWAIPFVAILLSDIFIQITKGYGFGSFSYPIYASYILIFLVSGVILKKYKIQNVVLASLTSSVLFFLITNFALFSPEAKEINMQLGLYTHDLKGVMASYAAGVPFFRNMVIGDLFYSGVLFGSYELYKKFSLKTSKA